MKKLIKTVLSIYLLLGLTIAASAQSEEEIKSQKRAHSFVQKVDKKLKLTKVEKEKLEAFKLTHITSLKQINKDSEKGTQEFKANRMEAIKTFNRTVRKAFGKERAKAINQAGKPKKK